MKKFISAISGFQLKVDQPMAGAKIIGGKKKDGFSLLEVIIVLSIISIMTIAGIAKLQSGRNETYVESSALEVVAAIREAQNNALTGRIPNPGSADPDVPCDYVFQPKNGSDSSYEIAYHYRDGAGICTEGTATKVYATYHLKNGVTINNFTAITFSIPSGSANIGSSIILSKNGNNPDNVCVDQAGSIRESKDPC